jgi:hypothetical protein
VLPLAEILSTLPLEEMLEEILSVPPVSAPVPPVPVPAPGDYHSKTADFVGVSSTSMRACCCWGLACSLKTVECMCLHRG